MLLKTIVALVCAFMAMSCDAINSYDTVPVPDPDAPSLDEPVLVSPVQGDYFPMAVGNRWTFSIIYARTESFSTDLNSSVSTINATGELSWEVVAKDPASGHDEFLVREQFKGEEKNQWFCRSINPWCPESSFEKIVPRSWDDTLRVISKRDSLWFSYEKGFPVLEDLPYEYPFGTPYITITGLAVPRYRFETPDTLRFVTFESLYPSSGEVKKDAGLLWLSVSCDFLGSHRLHACRHQMLLQESFLVSD